jgi:hypothetical protein
MAEVGGQLYEFKSLMSSNLSNFFCKFIPRSCNKVAIALVAKGLKQRPDLASMLHEIASKKLLTSNILSKLNSLYAPLPVGPACHTHENQGS